jgi:hypothetical protein
MSMSDGKIDYMKICFQFGDRVFRFAINPDSYVHSKPHRTAVVKTKSKIYVQDFQDDIHTIKISGTTGWNPTGDKEDRGIAKIKEMKQFLQDFSTAGGNGGVAPEDFYFWNFTNEEYYVVALSPEGITFTQSADSPLLTRYEIKFIVLREASKSEEYILPIMGNPAPTITPYTGKIGTSGLVYTPYDPNIHNIGTVSTKGLVYSSSNPNKYYSGGVAKDGLTYNPSYPSAYTGNVGTNGLVYNPTYPQTYAGVVSTNGLKYVATYPQNSSGQIDSSGLVYTPSYPQGYAPNVATGGTGSDSNFSPYAVSLSNTVAINPQAPSQTAYYYGFTGLGLNIGYYGRGY